MISASHMRQGQSFMPMYTLGASLPLFVYTGAKERTT